MHSRVQSELTAMTLFFISNLSLYIHIMISKERQIIEKDIWKVEQSNPPRFYFSFFVFEQNTVALSKWPQVEEIELKRKIKLRKRLFFISAVIPFITSQHLQFVHTHRDQKTDRDHGVHLQFSKNECC